MEEVQQRRKVCPGCRTTNYGSPRDTVFCTECGERIHSSHEYTEIPWRAKGLIAGAVVMSAVAIAYGTTASPADTNAWLTLACYLAIPALATTFWLGWQDERSNTTPARTWIRTGTFAVAISLTTAGIMSLVVIGNQDQHSGNRVEPTGSETAPVGRMAIGIYFALDTRIVPLIPGGLVYVGAYFLGKWARVQAERRRRRPETEQQSGQRSGEHSP